MMAVALDLLTRVRNIHWASGLAVEFEDDHLTFRSSFSTSQAVISLWFRVPAASIAAATADWNNRIEDAGFEVDATMRGIVPIITFGPRMTQRVYRYDVDASDNPIQVPVSSLFHNTGFIGVYCDEEPYKLAFRAHLTTTGEIVQPPGTFAAGLPILEGEDWVSVGMQDGTIRRAGSTFEHVEVSADEWHHVMISWNGDRFWWAFDDVNYNGPYLWPCGKQSVGLGGDDNEIITSYAVANNAEDSNLQPFIFQPFKIPTSLQWNYKVEMAELQFFLAASLDTSITDNRRAFLDYTRDENGDPIRDKNGKLTLKPAKPARAEQLLGKRPAVLLHTTKKWQQGNNTGSLGLEKPSGEALPDGWFTVTGKIEKYTPDPSIKQ